MGKGEDGQCIFPLTSLQIGDLQSYLSDLSLFLANDSKKIYILVDNRPWLRDLGSRGAHFWQLMVTKSRLSPFANTKARRERKEGKEICKSSTSKPKKLVRMLSKILSRKKVLLPVKKLRNSLQFSIELHRTLYGFIVFEVAWNGVRGINYLNELQTDTLLSIEAKFMQRWEFDSIAQAANCMSSWFSGTLPEQLRLKGHLDSARVETVEGNLVLWLIVAKNLPLGIDIKRNFLFHSQGDHFYDACEDFSGIVHIDDDDDDNICNGILTVEDSSVHCLGSNIEAYSESIKQTMGLHLTTPSKPYKRRKVMKSFSAEAEVESYSKEMPADIDNSMTYSETSSCFSENADEATQYRDVLISFRFNDHDLPFKLREVIISDLRLLTLLEAGLPSWVIFLQSYPVFCHIYRPWICPLARVLYVLISFVTVLVGLYDLYKNVPVLKATASRLCGPLFDWIETWEMVSRIKYLATMMFLNNFQKAVRWCLAFTYTTQSFFSVLVQPLAEPLVEFFGFLLPSWNMLFKIVASIFFFVWYVIETFFNLVGDLLELLFLPLWFIITVVKSIATSILYPIFWISCEILYAPIRLVLAIYSSVAFLCTCMSDILGDIWQFVSSIFQLASSSEATISTNEVSMWRSLWNDLFSQIFRALRSILNGFVDFFAACNRHRLSIYNHIQKFVQKLYRRCQISQQAHLRDGGTTRVTQNLADEWSKVH